MAEYIERKAVLQKQIGVVVYDEGGWDANVRAVQVEDIEAVPAADVDPVVHGRWEKITIAVVDTTGYCSVCGEQAVWRSRNKPYAICPNCGAKVDAQE